jgi:hypothetical protein
MTYRCLIIATGGLFEYLGYRLFVLGIYEKAGELKASWKGASLLVRQAAPGTFFALFGATIITVAVVRPAEFHNKQSVTPTTLNAESAGGPEATDRAALATVKIALGPIVDKLQKGQPLTKKDKDDLADLYLSVKVADLSRMTETDSHTMLDNMK